MWMEKHCVKKQQHVLFKVVSLWFWFLILTAGRRRPARRWRPAGPGGWTSFCRRSPGGGTLRGPSSVRSRDTQRRCESKIQRRREVVHTDATGTYLQQNLHRENRGEGVVGITKNLQRRTNTQVKATWWNTSGSLGYIKFHQVTSRSIIIH